MNDDLSPSVVAREPQPAPDNENAHEQNRTDHDTEERPASGSPTLSQPAPAASSTTEVTRRQRRRAGLAKKLQFLIHLLKNLDMLFFAELCVLYYMEYAPQFRKHIRFLWPSSNLPSLDVRSRASSCAHSLTTYSSHRKPTLSSSRSPRSDRRFSPYSHQILYAYSHISYGAHLERARRRAGTFMAASLWTSSAKKRRPHDSASSFWTLSYWVYSASCWRSIRNRKSYGKLCDPEPPPRRSRAESRPLLLRQALSHRRSRTMMPRSEESLEIWHRGRTTQTRSSCSR